MKPDKKDNEKSYRPKTAVNKGIKDHSNNPFFVKKAEASKKTIEKYGLPKQLTKARKGKQKPL